MAKPIQIQIAGDATNFNKAIDGVTSKLGSLGSKMSSAGKGIATGLGAAAAGIIGLGAASATAAVSFEKSMGEVFTLLPGISAAAMDEMSAQVGAFSKDFGVLPEEVVPALYAALSAGVPADTVFDYMETATKLATGGVTDLDTAVDGLSSVVNAYGSEIIGAGEASDIMFTAVRFGKTTVDEIASSISDVTPIAAAVGVGFDEVGASLAVLTAAGVPTTKATTMMKGAMGELAKENSVADKAFRELAGVGFTQFIAEGGTLTEGLGLMADGAEATGGSVVDMFGSIEAGSAVLALTKDDSAALVGVMAEMDNSAGATDKAFATMSETTAFQLDKIKASVQVLMIQLGRKLIPVIQKVAEFFNRTLLPALERFASFISNKVIPVLEKLWKRYLEPLYKNVIKRLVDAFNKLTDSGKKLAPVFAALAAVAALAAIALGLWLASMLLAAAPVILLLAAVALLAAGLVYAYQNFEGFRNLVDGVVAWFLTTALPKMKEFGEQLKIMFTAAFEAILAVITFVVGVIKWIWDKWGEDIVATARAMWDGLMVVMSGLITMLTGVFKLITAVLSGEWGAAWEAIKMIARGAWTVLKGMFQIGWAAIKLIWTVYLDLLKMTLSLFWKAIKLYVTTAMDLIKLYITTALTAIKIVWGVIWNTIATVASVVWLKIKGYVSSAIDFIKVVISTALAAIKLLWTTVWNGVSNFVAGVWNKIKGYVSGGIDSVVGFVTSLPGKIKDSIGDGFNGIWENFKGVINRIIRTWNGLRFPSLTLPVVDLGPLGKIGGGTFGGWTLPPITPLAKGGVVDSPLLAMIGEGGEREIVTPDRLLRQIVREESGMGKAPVIEQHFYGFSTEEAHELAKQGTAAALRELAMRRRK
jgi:TP901 family phage tail tape measure protein